MIGAANCLEVGVPRWVTDLPKAVEPVAAVHDTRPNKVQAVRFVSWALTLRAFPSVQDIVARWGCSRATAYRWRSALADGFGLVLPPNPPGVESLRKPARRAP